MTDRGSGFGSAVRLASAARAGVAAIAAWKVALVVATGLISLLFFVGLFVSSSSTATIGGHQVCSVGGKVSADIPAGYVPWLEKAVAKYRLGPRGFGIVAAVHKIETNFARSNLPGVSSGENSAGAGGPGQFLAPTWAAYGQDADGDGVKDRYSIPDSVFGTANYLRASGAPGDWRAAIFAYNHADWYVNDVLAQAEDYQGEVSCRLVGGGQPTVQLGSIDWNDTSGSWAGSKKFADLAKELAKRHGCQVISAKRSTFNTASGGVSDHYIGARHSYAYDLAACGLGFPGGAADQTARDIAVAFGLPAHTGVVSAYRGRYRIQLLWQTWTGGNHYNHVHIGVRNQCCPGG